jgi:CheY-like chemotaxis protein
VVPPAPQVPGRVRTAAARRSALVVDDEAPIRGLLARMLANRDFAVTEARSYAELQTVSALRHFDVVLCDVRLGDANGAQCLRYLRDSQPGIERRFVFMSGDIGALEGIDAEAERVPVLAKPFTAADLDRALGTVEVPA